MTLRGLIAAAALSGGFLLLMSGVSAQHNHSSGHGEYQGWASGKVANCCDTRDCGELRESEVRETDNGTQVRIDGQWCPVLRQHYLVRGKSPDWSVPHACVSQSPHADPCERLLCFTPKGGF